MSETSNPPFDATRPAPTVYRAHLESSQAPVDPRRLKDGYDAWFGTILPDERTARILDFGCGRGDFLDYLQLRGYTRLEGLDVIPDFIQEIKRRTGSAIHLVEDPTAFLASHTEQYDCIVLKDVLEHIPHMDIVPLLCALRRSLCPEGRLIVSGPHAASPTGIYTRYLDFTHTICFTVPSLSYAYQCAGFPAPQSVTPRVRLGLRPGRLALAVARRLWFSVLRAIYFIELPGDPARPPHFYNRLVMWADRT